MAAVSAWAKPGAWALESEEQEQNDNGYASSSDSRHSVSSDFPSLSAAATAKIPKKKSKKQTLTLAEFATVKFQRSSAASDELLVLPTGPRERSAEELDRSHLGGGFRYSSYNSDGRGGARVSDESRRGPREPRVLDSGPSRADEVDNWGSMKKSVGAYSERRERLFDSQSKADESESWISSKKSYAPPLSEGRRERRGFDFSEDGSNGRGVDADNWGRKREENGGRGLDSDNWGKKREENGERGIDSDNWGKKREENGGSGRPRLVLQPRSVPLVNGNNGEEEKKSSKGGNPFGDARPREEVLKEKGKDWKEIDEKLEAVKIKEGMSLVGKKANGNGLKEDRTERAWRMPETPPRVETVEEEQLPEN